MCDGFDINKCHFRLDRKIGAGATGSIFEETANNRITCVVKKQLKKDDISLIKEEDLYLALNNQYLLFPARFYFGNYRRERILVLSRHGKDLYDLTVERNGLPVETVAMVLVQMANRLEVIHNKGFIHRDIKPENIVVGRYINNKLEQNDDLYVIDYGSSSRFRYWDGKHIQPGDILTDHGGTEVYGSVRFHKKKEQSRRDDLISLCYTIVFLYKQTLPWAHLINKPTEMLKMKRLISADTLFKGFPTEFRDAFLYINSLHFDEKPSYNIIMKFMFRFLNRKKFSPQGFSFLK